MRHEFFAQRGPLTLVTTGALVGMYVVYGLAMGAIINPPEFTPPVPLSGPNKPASAPPRENELMARKHLADHPWVAAAPFRVRTADAFMYWEKSEISNSGDSVEMEPFAMIWTQGDRQGNKPPITIVAEKAELKFSSKLSIQNPNPTRVVEAALRGVVEIRGPDNLHVVGKTFYFTEKDMQIFSADRVQFTQGPHRGEALGVEIYLERDPNVVGEDRLAIAGVDSVLLRHEVKLELQINPRPNSGDTLGQAPNAQSAVPARPATVHVQSAGSFRFSVKDSVATFRNQVVVDHPDPSEPNLHDRLHCDVLTLVFERLDSDPTADPPAGGSAAPPAEAATPSETVAADSAATPAPDAESTTLGTLGPIDARLAFRQLTASGNKVEFISEGNQLHARMAQLEYDAVHRRILLKDPEGVTVQQAANQMQCPQITLLHSENGRVSHVWCQGVGWLEQRDAATGAVQLSARWKNYLRKYPEKDSTLDILEIDQEALVEQPAESFRLAAGFIKLWADPNGTSPGIPGTAGDQPAAGRFRPDRLLAEDNVQFGTPKLKGQSKKLQVWFEQRTPGAGPALQVPNQTSRWPAAPNRFGPNVHLASYRRPGNARAASIRPRRTGQYSVPAEATNAQPVQEPPGLGVDPFQSVAEPNGSANGPANPAHPAGAEPPPLPAELSADLIRLRVLQGKDPKDTTIADVWTYGNVRIAQPQPDGTVRELKGERLEMANRSEQDQVLRVLGNNASIRDGGLVIEGPDIQFDRRQNLLTVSGAGTLELPVTRRPDGTPLETPQTLSVWWKERMVFDGKSANFFGLVRGILDENTMTCAHMEVVLTKPISFGEDSGQTDTDVALVICKNGVEFKSKQMEGETLTGYHEGKCAEFTLNQQTGETTALGPGRIDSWRRGGSDPAGLAGNVRAKPNAAAKSGEKPWKYTRVEFEGRMSGNVTRKFTRFQDRVHIVYGPVDRPSVGLDPDNLPNDGGEMRSNTLDLTQLTETASGDGKTYIEVLARGNVKVSGQSFQALADEVSYDESKGFYILRGEGNRDASLYRQVQLGGERDSITAKELHFNPTTFMYKVIRASSAVGSG